MKRLILIAAFILTAGTLAAQNYIIVNGEKVFKSIDAYNTAISDLDKLAKQYQTQVDTKFNEVETLYNNYQVQKTSLSAAARQVRENAILQKEKEAQEYQESLFGQEGTLMKKRVEMISPIQKQVFAAIEAYAKQVGADLVFDSANNPTLLYNNPAVERTQQVLAYERQRSAHDEDELDEGKRVAVDDERPGRGKALQRQGKNGKDEGPQYACGPEKGVQTADAAQQSLELGSKVHDTSIG